MVLQMGNVSNPPVIYVEATMRFNPVVEIPSLDGLSLMCVVNP